MKNRLTRNHPFEKRLIVSAVAYGRLFTNEEIEQLHMEARKRQIGNSRIEVQADGGLGVTLSIFDFYSIEELSFFQRLRHELRKSWTAAIGYLGMNTVLIVVH